MSYRGIVVPEPRTTFLRCVNDSMWFYPKTDVDAVLALTTIPYTFDGTHIVCPTIADIESLYQQIFEKTTVSSGSLQGYRIGVGSFATDYKKSLTFSLPTGHVVVRWTYAILIKQQGAEAPDGTVGYFTTLYNGDNYVGSGIFDMTFMGRTG